MNLSQYSKNMLFTSFFYILKSHFLVYFSKYVLRRDSKTCEKIHQKSKYFEYWDSFIGALFYFSLRKLNFKVAILDTVNSLLVS